MFDTLFIDPTTLRVVLIFITTISIILTGINLYLARTIRNSTQKTIAEKQKTRARLEEMNTLITTQMKELHKYQNPTPPTM